MVDVTARRQLPLLAGVLIGWGLLWWLGSAMVLSDDFHGYGWPGYVINAWSAFHGIDAGYDAFRQPMHGWLLGALGEQLGSYPHAAVIVSSLSVGAMVLAAGLIAGQLGGPWAGGLAAASLAMVAQSAAAARAANHYPLQSGLAGMAVALALISARREGRGGWGAAALAGLLAGMAVAVDSRMAFYAAIAGAMLVVSARPGRVLSFAALAWIGPRLGDALVLPEQPMMPTAHVMALQRPVLLRWARDSRDPAMVEACASADPSALPSLAGLQTPCAQAMWNYNVSEMFPSHFLFGVPITVAAVAVALLGWALSRSWRDGLLGGLWLGGTAAVLVVQALWVPLPDRYLVPWAVPLATAVPIAIGRLPGRWTVALAALAAGGWAWQADLTERHRRLAHQLNRVYALRQEARWIVADHIGEDSFLDCSGLFISVSLLPRITSPLPPQFKNNPARCARWIASPPARAWVAVDRATGGHQEALQAAGWSLSYRDASLALWQAPAYRAESEKESIGSSSTP